MKTLVRLIRNGSSILFVIFALSFAVLLCLERVIAWRTPSLELLGQRVREADLSTTFEYEKSIQMNLHAIASEYGISQFVVDWLGSMSQSSNSIGDSIGASGFLFAGLQPQNGAFVLKRFDHFIDSYFKSLDQAAELDDANTNTDENETDPDNEDFEDFEESTSLVAVPLQQAIEAVWNSGFLNIGGAVELDMNFLSRLQLGVSLLGNRDEAYLRTLAIRSMPLKLQQLLINEIFDQSTFRIDKEKKSGIYFGNLDIDTDSLETLFETICPEEPSAFDGCSYLLPTEREVVQQHLETLIALLDDDFEATLHFYWTLRGKTLVFANRSSVLKTLTGISNISQANQTSDTPLIVPVLQSLSQNYFKDNDSSIRSKLMQGIFSCGVNLTRMQDNMLTLLAMLRIEQRRQTLLNQDLLSTPQTEEALAVFEETILGLSNQFKKITFGIGLQEKTIVPMLWTEPNIQSNLDIRNTSENFLVSGIGHILYPQSKNVSRALIPIESIKSSEWSDIIVFTHATILTKQLSPIVQKHFRNLPSSQRSKL